MTAVDPTDREATGWIAVDWGTSRLRVWAMTAAGEVAGIATSDEGMGRLAPAGFEPALLRAAGHLLPGDRPVDVLICGMAGARGGWQEVSYTAVPCAPVPRPEPVAGTDPRLRVRIIPGLCQTDPPDVMRGEETQIAGVLATHPGFDGVLCLPGTHTKWVRVESGQVRGFRTVMTGELFDLIGTVSTLAGLARDGWDATAFDASAEQAMREPGALAADLFGLRAAALLGQAAPGAVRARLSGLLIGQEVAFLRRVWKDVPVTLVADDALGDLYDRVFRLAGQSVDRREAATLTLAGLRHAARRFREDMH